MSDSMELSTPEKDKTSSIHLRGELSKPPSRVLWLLKWLLAVPHIVILAFLTVAVVFVTIIAFFAIIFTGRYPRKSFDFVVGVFRWWWRVGFYAFSVLGTDKYPPFSLKPRDDYPADLHIDYPKKLKQWFPLVKWFLAVPHYFVLIAFVGYSQESTNLPGLGPILILIALIVLLFTGRYLKDIFRLVMGINRWGYRVSAYICLLTDEYPHFRLMD
ncbi:MAG: hypothetical protein [Olavius algarvensis spirochete endosymbiont]|nr:MAG: hypothetical protein [Olavius algarvensis spirochete endosymbiont]